MASDTPERPTSTDINYSYSGSDITAVVTIPTLFGSMSDPVELKTMVAFSYSTYKDKSPVRRLGHTNPVGFTDSIRTIAGTLVFITMKEDPLQHLVNTYTGATDRTDPNIRMLPDQLPPFNLTLAFENKDLPIGKTHNVMVPSGGSLTPQWVASDLKKPEIKDTLKMEHILTEVIHPRAIMHITGIVLVNNGTTYGIDESQIETTVQYIATDVSPMVNYSQTAWIGLGDDNLTRIRSVIDSADLSNMDLHDMESMALIKKYAGR